MNLIHKQYSNILTKHDDDYVNTHILIYIIGTVGSVGSVVVKICCSYTSII